MSSLPRQLRCRIIDARDLLAVEQQQHPAQTITLAKSSSLASNLALHLLCRHCSQLAADSAERRAMFCQAVVEARQALRRIRAGSVERVEHELRVALEVLILDEQAHAAQTGPRKCVSPRSIGVNQLKEHADVVRRSR